MSPDAGIPPDLPSPVDFAQGLVQGVWGGVKSVATGLYDLGAMSVDGYKQLGALGKELYSDPQAREAAMQAVKDLAKEGKDFAEYLGEDPQQTIATAKEGVLAAANAAKAKGKELLDQERQAYADALAKGEGSKFIGRAFGRTVFEVGSLFFGVGQAAKAGKLAKVSEVSKMSKAETFVLPCGKVVTKAEFEAAAKSGAAMDVAEASKFKPQGWVGNAVETQVGRDMIESMVAAGTDRDAAIGYVQRMLESGEALPVKVPLDKGSKLYKLSASGASDATPYWMSAEELETLRGLSNAEIADKLGLPLSSLPKDGAPFIVQEIEAIEKTEVFVSKVAKTAEGGVSRAGGAMQSLVTQRMSKFSPPSAPKPFR